MLIETASTKYQAAFSVFATDPSFATVSPTVTEPTGDGIVSFGFGAGGGLAQNGVRFLIVGTGANNAVITGLRVYSWDFIPSVSPLKPLWIPTLLCELAAVFGNKTGAVSSSYSTTVFFADTITLTTGNSNTSVEVLSPTGEEIAHVVLDAKGAQKLGFYFDLGANATGANVFLKSI